MSYESDDKMVSHPDHYNSGKFEVIDIIEEFTKDLSGIEAVDTANAIKYVLRWHKKNGVQDVKKAIWYLTHLAEHLEEKENPSKPLGKEYDGPDEHCRTCRHRFATPENDKICENCYGRENYEPDTEKIGKEESELSVKSHTNVAGITVPDSQPWSSSESPHICSNCAYYLRKSDLEPCICCYLHSNWTPKEKMEEERKRDDDNYTQS